MAIQSDKKIIEYLESTDNYAASFRMRELIRELASKEEYIEQLKVELNNHSKEYKKLSDGNDIDTHTGFGQHQRGFFIHGRK